ncbi:MAG: VOC family protein [Deltaproteobacteria bacterium]|nr:VOC family protein [Deltaproteobacteria bacterium]
MIFFEDLLRENDFTGAVNSIAADFRKKHDFPEIHQLGLVVPDVIEAAKKYEAKGIGPFFIAEGAPMLWKERGKKKTVSGKMGLAHFKGFEIELLEPLEGSDFYTKSLGPDGKTVLQHLGFIVKDVDARAEALEASDLPVYVRGILKSGPMNTDFAYMEPIAPEEIILEFISWRFLGLRFTPPAAIIRTLGRIEKWTGKRSISM